MESKPTERNMSVKTQIFLAKTFAGLCWIGAGVSGYFDSVFTDVLQIIFLASVVIALIVLVKAKREIYDEMFLENYQHAQAKTEDVMQGVFCIAIAFRFWFVYFFSYFFFTFRFFIQYRQFPCLNSVKYDPR